MTKEQFLSKTQTISDPQTDSIEKYFRGKRVLVTGHTGFKGSWLTEWLLGLGSEVWGFSLKPPTSPALFDQLGLAARMHHNVGDVRDLGAVLKIVHDCRPQFVFHLAAQPLVRASYEIPVETYATNVMGTVHVLEALRSLKQPCAAVIVTTDKCYENREWDRPYTEDDSLGGYDPYSSSKGAAEIVVSAYRRSFFPTGRIGEDGVPPVAVASARAGNVVGGGDWALDRIVPDCMKALEVGKPIGVRNPSATRPWQHVLEPLGGYLTLAACISSEMENRAAGRRDRLGILCSAFNFGPNSESNRSVLQLVEELIRNCPGSWTDLSNPNSLHEARLLSLSIEKAARELEWSPRWKFERTIAETVTWYVHAAKPGNQLDAGALTRRQIAEYGALRIPRFS